MLLLTFSSRRFAGCQGVLLKKDVDLRWPHATYTPERSKIGTLTQEWVLDAALLMFYKEFPKRIHFKVEKDSAKS